MRSRQIPGRTKGRRYLNVWLDENATSFDHHVACHLCRYV